MNRIDLWLKSLAKAFEATGEIAPWPVHVAIPSIYCGDHEAADLYAKVKKIYQEDQPDKILSKLHVGPSVAKALLMDLICGLKVAKPAISKKERIWFVEEMFDSIEELQTGDIFCLNKKNLIFSKIEAQKIYQETPWIWVNNKSKQNLAQSFYKTSSSTKSLIWSLFFYGWDDVGYEIHGPYDVEGKNGRKYQLVITDYFDLKPTLLWPRMETFSYNSVKLMALYHKKAALSIDMFIHFINQGSLLETTAGIYIEADGMPIRTEKLAELLSQQVLERVKQQYEAIETMSKSEVIKKYIESRYYAFRRWRWYFGEDWCPPQAVFDRIKKWGIIEIPPGKSTSWKELKKAFDPRTNYVPVQDKH